jgi:hypothetical protein
MCSKKTPNRRVITSDTVPIGANPTRQTPLKCNNVVANVEQNLDADTTCCLARKDGVINVVI